MKSITCPRQTSPALGLLLAAAFVSCLRAACVTFEPPDANCRILFPPSPDFSKTTPDGRILLQWTARDDGFIYIFNNLTLLPPDQASPEGTIEANLAAFLDSTKATLIAKKKGTWPEPGPNGPVSVPAVRFSFRMPTGRLGEGLFVIDSHQLFGAEVLNQQETDRRDAMVRYVNSLEVLR